MDGDTFQVVSNKEEQAITSIDNFSGYIESDSELAKVNFPPQVSSNFVFQMPKQNIPSCLKKRGDKSFKSSNIETAVKHYSDAILSIRYLLRQGLIDMMSLNNKMLVPVIVPCNLNLALCYLKLSEAILLKNPKNKLKDEYLEKCIKVCDDVVKLWDMQKTQSTTSDKKQMTKIKAAKAYVRKGKALEMLNRIPEATGCFNRVLKIDKNNALAKEALLKIGAKHDASANPIPSIRTEEIHSLKNRDLFKRSEANTASLSGDQDLSRIDNELLRGVNTQRIQMDLNGQNTAAEMEELIGLRGALILIVRIIFDIIGGLFGYGTISPTYYNYM